MTNIILASSSATRAALLKKAGVKFRVVKSSYREHMDTKKTPRMLARYLAYQKALSVAKKYPNALVIGADTLMVLDGKAYGKPRNERDHRAMLKKMSGRRHTMVTGVAIIGYSGSEKIFSRETHVTFRKLSEQEIKKYVVLGEGKIAAGGYRILRGAKKFVKRTLGGIDTVAGLPLRETLELLSRMR